MLAEDFAELKAAAKAPVLDPACEDIVLTRWPLNIKQYPRAGEAYSWTDCLATAWLEYGTVMDIKGRANKRWPVLRIKGPRAWEVFKHMTRIVHHFCSAAEVAVIHAWRPPLEEPPSATGSVAGAGRGDGVSRHGKRFRGGRGASSTEDATWMLPEEEGDDVDYGDEDEGDEPRPVERQQQEQQQQLEATEAAEPQGDATRLEPEAVNRMEGQAEKERLKVLEDAQDVEVEATQTQDGAGQSRVVASAAASSLEGLVSAARLACAGGSVQLQRFCGLAAGNVECDEVVNAHGSTCPLCVTCYGRLFQLRQALPVNLLTLYRWRRLFKIALALFVGDTEVSQALEFLAVYCGHAIDIGLLQVCLGGPELTSWHSSIAKNTSHRAGLLLATGEAGGEESRNNDKVFLVNLDCDNLASEEFCSSVSEVLATLSTYKNAVCCWKGQDGGITGRIGLRGDTFLDVGGYQQALGPAGYQDIDLKNRVEKLPEGRVVWHGRRKRLPDFSIPNDPEPGKEMQAKIAHCSAEAKESCKGSWGRMDGKNRKLAWDLIGSGQIKANVGQMLGVQWTLLATPQACMAKAKEIQQTRARGATGSASGNDPLASSACGSGGATGSSSGNATLGPSACGSGVATGSSSGRAAVVATQDSASSIDPPLPQRPMPLRPATPTGPTPAQPTMLFTYGRLLPGESPLQPPRSAGVWPGRVHGLHLISFGIKNLSHTLRMAGQSEATARLAQELDSCLYARNLRQFNKILGDVLGQAGLFPVRTTPAAVVAKDVRDFWDPQGHSKHTGLHPTNVEGFVQHRQFRVFLAAVFADLMTAWRQAVAEGTPLVIALFCVRGKHRSISGVAVLQHLLQCMLVEGRQLLPAVTHLSERVIEAQTCGFCRRLCLAQSTQRDVALGRARVEAQAVLERC